MLIKPLVSLLSIHYHIMPPHDDSPTDRNKRPSPTNNNERHNRRSKKVKVFEGLTDEQRRQVRQEQRHLYDRLVNNDGDVDDLRRKNNRLFKSSVRFTREAVLDGDITSLVTDKLVKQVEQTVQVRRLLCLILYYFNLLSLNHTHTTHRSHATTPAASWLA